MNVYIVSSNLIIKSCHKTLKGAKDFVKKEYGLTEFIRMDNKTIEFSRRWEPWIYIDRKDLKL